MSPTSRDRPDWSQLWYPGPTRRFTPEEMARAGTDAPSATLTAAVVLNYALFGFMLLQVAPAAATAALTLLFAVGGVAGAFAARRLWRQPHRAALGWISGIGVLLLVGTMVGVIELHRLPAGSAAREWVKATGLGLTLVLTIGWWFVAVWRAHQIEARLREQAEQQRALELARQLAAAQVQPHFLFNALASLQHWVQSKDDRAAPMLAALTGFLRATLPLFNRERLALGDEAGAVREYLAVMQLRLGERLRHGLDIEPAAAAAGMPPGLLLTLVENAVEHGVMPALDGAEVHVSARVDGAQVELRVRDSGPGLAPGAAEGTGLANSRARLAQAWGSRASLHLQSAEGGGCEAVIRFPRETA